MRTVRPMSWLTMLLLSATAWNVAAVASATPSAPTAPSAPVAVSVAPASSLPRRAATAAPAKPSYVAGMGLSVDPSALEKFSGGTDVIEKMTLNGSVSNNTTDQVVTGSNEISTGSFNGAAGVPMLIQNTGNGVLIQNATIINVQFQP